MVVVVVVVQYSLLVVGVHTRRERKEANSAESDNKGQVYMMYNV